MNFYRIKHLECAILNEHKKKSFEKAPITHCFFCLTNAEKTQTETLSMLQDIAKKYVNSRLTKIKK